MRNTYAGVCYRCGLRVAAGAGHFEKVTQQTIERLGEGVRGKKWILQHAECAIANRGTDVIAGGKKSGAEDYEDIS